jgi:hypothetical protein
VSTEVRLQDKQSPSKDKHWQQQQQQKRRQQNVASGSALLLRRIMTCHTPSSGTGQRQK